MRREHLDVHGSLGGTKLRHHQLRQHRIRHAHCLPVHHYGGLDCHIVLGKARDMSFSVKNSLSLSLSVSYIRTFLRFVSSRRAPTPSQRVSNVPILSPFHVHVYLFSYSHSSFVYRQISLVRLEIDRERQRLGFAKGKTTWRCEWSIRVVDSTRVRSILSVVSLTYPIYVYLSSIACRRSLLLIRLLKFLNVIVYFVPS